MKIYSNQFNRKNTTFGYNKELNTEVVRVLKKESSPFSKYLLSLNSQCNKLEKEIDFTQKSKYHIFNDSYNNNVLTVLFTDLKGTFTNFIKQLYPELNYAKAESEAYKKEIGANSQHWKNTIKKVIDDIDKSY